MISDIGKYPHITRSRITGDWTDRAHVLPFSRLHLHAKRENGSCRGRPHACTCRRAVCTCPQTGEICLDILKNAWSPAWTLQSTCQAIVALMSDAAPDSPLNCALAMCAATTPSPTCTPPSMPRQCRLYGCRRRCMRLRHVHKALGSPFV